jgi:hypothetical protein
MFTEILLYGWGNSKKVFGKIHSLEKNTKYWKYVIRFFCFESQMTLIY